jgi:hypothetical protein
MLVGASVLSRGRGRDSHYSRVTNRGTHSVIDAASEKRFVGKEDMAFEGYE